MTCAQLRSAAREAREALQWAEAATLYTAAADAHPGNAKTQELTRLDINRLRSEASECKRMAASDTTLPDTPNNPKYADSNLW